METLLKGKAQYSWPPCTNLFRPAPFYIENIIYIINKTSNLNEEVNRTELPLSQYSLILPKIFSQFDPKLLQPWNERPRFSTTHLQSSYDYT
jgi:hypothetical protein